MPDKIEPFAQPIYVTRPLLPDLDRFTERLKEVWATGWLSNAGPQHRVLEERMRDVLKVPYVSLFNNGTIALMVAVQSLRLQGEVITTPFTFPATTHVLAWNGITPVFCDIHPETLTLDPDHIEGLITNKTTAILGVHVYGIPCHVKRIQEIADRHGLRVIYDAAHAFGAEIGGRAIGTWGDISMFSFHPTKLFHTAEGGALGYGNANLKRRIDLLKNFGITGPFEVILPGINGKMNELSAVMGQLVLDMVEEERRLRRAIRQQYARELRGIPGISIVSVPDDVKDSQQYMVIRVRKETYGIHRTELFEYLKQHNVITRPYFYPLISDYPCYRQLPSANADGLPIARKVTEEVLALPFYGGLSDKSVTTICRMIARASSDR
ncbi:MAG: aminotransferase [Betaproteobacteria bacterium RIFCSPLOWO2_12_FULL_65_14]|nr:MAG: aminotransferase [Betaproteobacteria bacterium RIFCSPLOWO2_12_FULL_65_14]